MDLDKNTTEKIEEEAADWVLRMDSEGEQAVYDDPIFQNWLKQSEKHIPIFHACKKTWREMDDVGPLLMDRLETSNDNIPVKRFKWAHYPMRKIMVAAAMMYFAFLWSHNMHFFADETTATGEIRKVYLADGSTIILNSNSALDIELTDLGRDITLLKGEASFYVAKDKSRPFTVHVGEGQAKALGTIYTVRRRGEGAVVSVIESQVKVNLGGHSKILKAAERVMMQDDNLGDIEEIDIVRARAWERGKIIFENTPLSEVITEINTHFTGYIRLSNPEIRNLKVNGVFELSDPVALVDLLEVSLNLKSTRLTNRLIFLHK